MVSKYCLRVFGAIALMITVSNKASAAYFFPTFSFAYTGAEVSYSFDPGEYRIKADGAQGGGSFYSSGSFGNAGASVSATMSFTKQTSLRIVVGGQGKTGGGSTRDGSGGGGGTFVTTNTYVPLVVAGGGGGAGYGSSEFHYGLNASLSTAGTSTKISCFGGSGGTGGHSGNNSSDCADEGGGGGGAGIFGQGDSSVYRAGGSQGVSAPSFGGGAGGTYGYGSTGGAGGFGGGGGGGGGMPNCHCNGGADAGRGGGGGGGGYSGGGGGYNGNGGGGGGSFAATNATNVSASVLGTGGNGAVALETLRLYAQPTLASNTLDFGAVRVGASAPTRTLNVGNHAGAYCCLGGINNNVQDTLLVAGIAGPVTLGDGVDFVTAGQSADIQYKLSTQTSGFISGTFNQGLKSVLNSQVASGLVDLGSFAINFTGRVYSTAVASLNTRFVNFGATRVGDIVSRTLTITNAATGALADDLMASIDAPNVVRSSGTETYLRQGKSSTATFTYGSVAGVLNTVSPYILTSYNSDMGGLALQQPNVVFTGSAYASAVATLSSITVSFGTVRQYDSVTRQIGLTNSATGALTDVLVTRSGSGPAGVTIAAPSALLAGQSGVVDFTLFAGTTGMVSGTTKLGFTSHDSALADLALQGKTITVTGMVTDTAYAIIGSSSGRMGVDGNHNYTLDLGDVALGANPLLTLLNVRNDATSATWGELLGGAYSSLDADGFSFAGGSFNNLAGGGEFSFGTLGFNVAGLDLGRHSQTIDFESFSRFAGLDDLNLGNFSITFEANVIAASPVAGVPEPASWALFVGGFGLVGATMRRRKAQLA